MKKVIGYLDQNLERILCLILFGTMVILTTLQVVFRFGLNFSLDWTEELARYCFIGSIYAGAALGVKDDQHIRVEIMDVILPAKPARNVKLIADVIWLGFSIFITVQGFQMCSTFLANGQTSPTLALPMGLVYGVVPVGFFLMSIRIVQKILQSFRGAKPPADVK